MSIKAHCGLRSAAALLAVSTVVASCSKRAPAVAEPAPVVPAAAPLVCSPFDTLGTGGDTLEIAVTGPLDAAHVRAPRHAGEASLFARAYPALVRIDCDGNPREAIAASWGRDTTGWVFRISRDARFWDGSRVRASDVIDAWLASHDSVAMQMAQVAHALNDSTLHVAYAGSAQVFGANRLAVTRPRIGSRWPEGTGTHAIADRDGIVATAFHDSLPSYVFHETTLADARNFIDAGIDVLFTGDSATAAYAEQRASMRVVPLAWDRVWLLLIPDGVQPAYTDPTIPAALAQILRADARVPEPPAWTSNVFACGTSAAPVLSIPRIAFATDEPIARTLAERLVALVGGARAGGDSAVFALFDVPELRNRGLVIAPIAGRMFDAEMTAGAARAYVRSAAITAQRSCDSWRVVPLVETRWRIAVRSPPGAP